MSLTESERITILMMRGYGDRVRSYEEVKNLFNDAFPNRNPISKATVLKTVRRFEETGNCRDRRRSGRPAVVDEEKSLEILQHVVETPVSSLRKISQVSDVCFKSVHNVLIKHKYHPFKIHVVQELSEDDYERRIEFCDIMMSRFDQNNQFFKFIVFSDEATFMLNGKVNRHNCRFWANENPHWMREGHTQRPGKLNVWAGLLGNHKIGPFFIDGNLTSQLYLELLETQIVPTIRNVMGPNYASTFFQQDGAPPHFGRNVREFLNNTFPNRWIGRGGTIEWPPRSPDLSPNDYFLWGHLKNRVYTTKPQDLADLQRRILDEFELITPEMIYNTIEKFYFQLAHCQAVQGKQFEHLI